MTIGFVIDDRENASQDIREKMCRRTNKILFHLLKRPFKDSENYLVTTDRRSSYDSRIHQYKQ